MKVIITFSLSSIVVSLSLPVVEVSPFLVLDEASDADVTDTDDTEKLNKVSKDICIVKF